MPLFPSQIYPDAGAYGVAYFQQLGQAAASVDPVALSAAGELLLNAANAGNMVYSCGNGGSAAIANHLVCDHMKGVRAGTKLRPRVHSLSTTVELITAIANDFSVEEIFSHQLSSLAKPGDVLIAISSSGNSHNILAALEWAKSNQVATIAMTGFDGGQAAQLADISLHVSVDNYGLAEDVHQSLMHVLAQYLRHGSLTSKDTLGHVKF